MFFSLILSLSIHYLKICIKIILIILAIFILYQKNNTPKIPKVLHYVWVGGTPLPAYVHHNIETWKKNAPGYQIKRWDESNCDVNENEFVKTAYAKKEWTFVSDWCRFKALYQEGGIYLDTDAIINKAPDDLLHYNLFLTYEISTRMSASFIGASPQNPFILKILHEYPLNKNLNSSPNVITSLLKTEYPSLIINGKRQEFQGVLLLPSNFGMFDFGGGENYSEHFYANNRYGNSLNGISPYYHKFKTTFLMEQAILIKKKSGTDYLIPLTETTSYSYNTKEKAQIEEKDENIVIKWEKERKEIFKKKENGYEYTN